MAQNPLSGRALSALTVVPDLQPTDRLAVLRPTAADPLDQNVTLTADRLQFALLATLTPVVLTALAGLLAAKADLDATSGFVVSSELPPVTFASTTGNPLDNPLLRALLLANGSGSITSTYAQAQAAAAATPATLQVGKFYLLTARPNDATTNILVQANTLSTFAGSEAYSQAVSPAGSPYLPVTYVFAADTVTARVVTAPITTPLTTNALRGGAKIVDFLTPFAAMAPYQVALSQMPLSGLAIGTRAFVQNPTPTPATGAVIPPAYFVLARCAANDPLAVSAFVNGGGGAVTLQTPAKWVRESTAEGQAAFFSMFDPAGRPGTNDYPVNYVVKYVENGRLGTYEATQYLLQSVFLSQSLAGIPAPGGTSNAYWRAYSPAVAVQAPYVTISLAAAQTFASDPDSIQGILYHVLRGAAGDVLVQGVPTRAGATAGANSTPGGFSPIGIWCDPNATAAMAYTFVDYNLATDTVVRRISGTDLVTETAARIAADLLKVDKVTGSSLLANTEITRLLAITGTNTGDQNISGIAINATAITAEVAARVAGDATLQTQATANATAITTEVTARTAADVLKADLVSGRVPNSQLPAGLTYPFHIEGTADCSTGNYGGLYSYTNLGLNAVPFSPYIATSSALRGMVFLVTVAGNLPIAGALVGDVLVHDGANGWYKWAVSGGNNASVTALQTQVAANTTSITTNATAIASEATTRAAADTGLQTQASTNATNIATNATGITAEATARTAGDTALQTSITASASNITTLQGQASTNATNIAANTTKIGTATLATAATDLSAALNEIRNILPGIADRTGATYQLVLADAGTLVGVSSASAVTLTVPPNSTAAFPVGTIVNILQVGAGQVLVTAGTGVTIRQADSQLKSRKQWAEISLRKRAADEWVLTGDTAA